MSGKLILDGIGSVEEYLNAMGETAADENISRETIASMIDHTLLKADAVDSDIVRLCRDAREYAFKSVCINPYWVPVASRELQGSSVKVCTVIGFPLGATSTAAKAFEAEDAMKQGATEIDMVLNIGALKSGDYTSTEDDIKTLVKTTGKDALLKVILEVCLLSTDEIAEASRISMNAGAQFVKTSTGFSTGGATIEAVTLMRKTVGSSLGVKASGGIRDRKGALSMIMAGATRIGASAGIAIVTEKNAESENNY